MSYAPGEQNESQRDVLKLTNHKENPKCLKQATKEEGSRRNTCDMLPMAAASESGDRSLNMSHNIHGLVPRNFYLTPLTLFLNKDEKCTA